MIDPQFVGGVDPLLFAGWTVTMPSHGMGLVIIVCIEKMGKRLPWRISAFQL